MNFKPIKKTNLGNDVITQLKNHILKGDLKTGDKLPNERDLCINLEISRSSLREGLKVLEQQGLISRMNTGTYVTADFSRNIEESLTLQILLNDVTFNEIQETRLTLEKDLIALAAIRRTDEDLIAIREQIDQMKIAIKNSDNDLIIKADLKFHELIATAAKNTILMYLYNAIFHLVTRVAEYVAHDGSIFETSLNFHTEIYHLLVKKEAKLAQEKMEEHLLDVQKRIHSVVDMKKIKEQTFE